MLVIEEKVNGGFLPLGPWQKHFFADLYKNKNVTIICVSVRATHSLIVVFIPYPNDIIPSINAKELELL